MNVVMILAPIAEFVDERRIGMEVEDDRLVGGEKRIEVAVGESGCSVSGIRRKRSTMLTKRIFKSEKCSFRIATAASDSMVAMSPAQARTTSGSAPSSVEAQSQMPMPFVQCVTASSMVRY
jgi:hypothetical protein